VNGKVYIGQTTQKIQSRWKLHCLSSSNCFRMKLAIEKYGKESFVIEQIDECESKKDMNEKEFYWISHYRSVETGYNVKYSTHITEEIWRKTALKNTGKKRTPEAKLKMSLAAKGRKPWNCGLKMKKRAWNFGTKKQKIKIKKPSRSIAVLKYDTDSNFIESFTTIADASRSLMKELTSSDVNIVSSNIKKSCLRLRGIVYGHKWKFEKDKDVNFREEYIPKPVPRLVSIKAVKNNECLLFNSITEAAQEFKVSSANIVRSCRSHFLCGGYKFDYI